MAVLRSFRVANHKSIRDEQELLLIPAYDKSKPAVPVAAIFGANASGKSNLLDALSWMQTAVRQSYARWEPGAGVPRTPFRLESEVAARPSLYCVEIVVDGLRYTYGVEIDDGSVREEWLYAYPRNRRRVIFEREGDKIRFGSTVPEHRTRGDMLTHLTRDNALFLSVAVHNDVAEVKPTYQWFRLGLTFGHDGPEVDTALVRRLHGRNRVALVDLIRAADLGISDVTVDQHDVQVTRELISGLLKTDHLSIGVSKDVGRRLDLADTLDDVTIDNFRRELADLLLKAEGPIKESRLSFHHGRSGATLTLQEQSAGTRNWMRLVSSALAVLDAGELLVVDEFDASLHPHLTARLINLFRDAETNPSGAQLLFTTHDANLLDEGTLARDEIWFVEKDADSGATRLYPLTDFHPRKNENTEGRYMAGSYGAIPVLSDNDFREAMRGGRGSGDAAA